MGRLAMLQIEMLLMVCCGVVAMYAQEIGTADLSNACLTLAGGWSALGAMSVPWQSQGRIPDRT